jgi:D-glycero-D-manno-heptose 1,7-bisphosphate phosphatase
LNGAAIFLDRDGTLNELVIDPISGEPESPLRPQDVALIPGAAEAARRLIDAGWALIGVTNQPAAAKGTVTLAELSAVQARVAQLLSKAGVEFVDFKMCTHHPNGVVSELSGMCECRKPEPGMLIQGAAANDVDLSASWMIGDTDADVLAGQAAGCRTILLENPFSAHKRDGDIIATATMSDLSAAVSWLCRFNW